MTSLTPAVSDERDHIAGPASAPVTLVEYGDYQCPSCGRAYPIVKSLQQALGDELRFVFRNFPLGDAHPNAEHAAEAAEWAGVQGNYWGMHDALYENQQQLDDRALLGHASGLGLNPRELARALEDGAYRARVREDFRSGVRSGVNGTPTFFINGTRYDGNWTDAEEFLDALRGAASHA